MIKQIAVIICISIFVGIIGYFIGSEKDSSIFNEQTELIPNIQSDQTSSNIASLSTYTYENFNPKYYLFSFSYPEGRFFTSWDDNTLRVRFGGDGQGKKRQGYISVKNMQFPLDFCTNDLYLEEKLSLFSGIITGGIGKPICISNPSPTFRIPEDFNFDYLHGGNLLRGVSGIPADATILPMVIGSFYVQLAAYGSIDEANVIIKEVAKSLVFLPYFTQ